MSGTLNKFNHNHVNDSDVFVINKELKVSDSIVQANTINNLENISLNLVEGAIPLTIRGFIDSFSAGDGEVNFWDANVRISFLSSAETMDIVSTSAADTNSAGTGIRAYLVSGLDSNFDPITEVVLMNGTTPVTTSVSFLRVRSLLAVSCGSGRVNAGAVTATSSSSASLQAFVNIGETNSSISHFTIPRGFTLVIKKVFVQIEGQLSGGPIAVVRTIVSDNGLTGAPEVTGLKTVIDSGIETTCIIDIPVSSPPRDMTDVSFVVSTDTNNTRGTFVMFGYIKANP